jgi:hypothetical protein
MGLFSFTDEQLERYLAGLPTDPAAGAAAAQGRLDAAYARSAAETLRTKGPRAALTEGTSSVRGAAMTALVALVGGSTFGTSVVIGLWPIADDATRLDAVRVRLRDQFARKGYPTSPERDKAAEDAAAAWRALELAEAAIRS